LTTGKASGIQVYPHPPKKKHFINGINLPMWTLRRLALNGGGVQTDDDI